MRESTDSKTNTDAELVELAIRRAAAKLGNSVHVKWCFELVADEIAGILKERNEAEVKKTPP